MDRLRAVESHWAGQAATFDDEPDHGLRDEKVRAAWAGRLAQWVPPGHVRVADLGCGTGSLSVLLAGSGAEVLGVDLAPAMIERAKQKARAAGVDVEFLVGDASRPDLSDETFDVVLSRHLLWTLPDPGAALSRWARLLAPGGRLVLIEGRWSLDASTDDPHLPWGGGVTARQLTEVLRPMFDRIDHYSLSEDEMLWGKKVTDERFAVVAHGA